MRAFHHNSPLIPSPVQLISPIITWIALLSGCQVKKSREITFDRIQAVKRGRRRRSIGPLI